MTLRYRRAPPLVSVGPPSARRRARGSRTTSTACADTEALFDLRDDAVRRIEELRVHLVPATDVVDREELLRERELRMRAARVALLDARQHGAEAVVGPDRLCRRRVEP